MKKDYFSSLYGSEDFQKVEFSLDDVIREDFEAFLTDQAEHLMFSDNYEQNIAKWNLENVAKHYPGYRVIINSMIKLCKGCNEGLIDLKIKQAGAIYADDYKEAMELQKKIGLTEKQLEQHSFFQILSSPKFKSSQKKTDFIPADIYTERYILTTNRSELNKLRRSLN